MVNRLILLSCLLFAAATFAQTNAYVHGTHKMRRMNISVLCEADSAVLYTGSFKTYRYLCYGNVAHINTPEIKRSHKKDSIVSLDFCPQKGEALNAGNQVILRKGQVLKIRLIREKGIRVPKKKQLKVALMINGTQVEFLSKRSKNRSCYVRKWVFDHYVKLPKVN